MQFWERFAKVADTESPSVVDSTHLKTRDAIAAVGETGLLPIGCNCDLTSWSVEFTAQASFTNSKPQRVCRS